eukprot:5070155-Amphidinium_carterae.1
MSITEEWEWRTLQVTDVKQNPRILEGIVGQLAQLLELRITHVDLRMPNIVVNPSGETRLVDLE